ncbi:MAG: diguanylate cyclase [Gammaproteobacteria bacterium]|nr:diguanylate cyclase [Gammaproteobacteria bacterium]
MTGNAIEKKSRENAFASEVLKEMYADDARAGRLRKNDIQDLLTGANHSRDFCGTRAAYINGRVKPLALILAILIPLWIPIDYLIVPSEDFATFAAMRGIAAVLFLGIVFLWTGQPCHLFFARLRLALLLLIPAVFYIISQSLLSDSDAKAAAIMGYSFFPFLLIALQVLFPLTLVEGLAFSLPIGFIVAGVAFYLGDTLTISNFGEFWLLTLLTGIALWAELAQLHMLLKLYSQATRDALTGLVNRRMLLDKLQRELERSHRYGHPLSVLLFDLDRLKHINDTHGHLTGDAVLQAFAKIVEAELRKSDLAGRYGGEEFVAVLSETDLAGAHIVAERVRQACCNKQICDHDDRLVGCTASAGVAQLHEKEDMHAFLDRADKALYTAKEKGRNRTVLAE